MCDTLKGTHKLSYFVPLIIKTARFLGDRGVESATYINAADNDGKILFDFYVTRIYPPFALLKSMNAKVTITELPFELRPRKGTVQIQVDIFDITAPGICKIIIESITCEKGNPSSVNRTTLLRKLEAEWSKGVP